MRVSKSCTASPKPHAERPPHWHPFITTMESPPECVAGYYCTRGSSSGTSTVCTAGNYCPANTPSATSYPCPAGTYSSLTGLIDQSQCDECPLGHYCPGGSTAPSACRVGTYQPETSAIDAGACLACEPGWACPTTGMWEMTTRCVRVRVKP